MALGVPSLVIDPASPEYAQHFTTDVNDALGRLTIAAEASIATVSDSVTALTATVATLVSNGGWKKITAQTASGASTVDFSSGIDSTYDCYMIELVNVVPGTDATDLYVRISTDGGATFKSGGADYSWHLLASTDVPSNAAHGTTAAAQADIAEAVGNAGGKLLNGTVQLFRPSAAVLNSHHFKTAYISSGNNAFTANGAFKYNTATAVNGIRFLMSGGTISGTFTLYGLTK